MATALLDLKATAPEREDLPLWHEDPDAIAAAKDAFVPEPLVAADLQRLEAAEAETERQLEQVFVWQIEAMMDSQVAAGAAPASVAKRLEREIARRFGVAIRIHVVDDVRRPVARATRRSGSRPGTSRRSRKTRAPAEPARPDAEPRPCSGCGVDFIPARVDQRHCSSGCRVRAHRKRSADAPQIAPELLQRADLARAAIVAGADPAITLSIVVWPPDTADDARQLLGDAA